MANPPTRSDHDDHHDYGWIGLLGLAGLLRRNHRVVPGTTNNVSGTGTGRLYATNLSMKSSQCCAHPRVVTLEGWVRTVRYWNRRRIESGFPLYEPPARNGPSPCQPCVFLSPRRHHRS
ncbi:hypothetical protein FV230_02720 [Methylobacterium sp. WL6]|nr:hypothetical protein FV230_02720 [Methylobacterium sp. WL6]